MIVPPLFDVEATVDAEPAGADHRKLSPSAAEPAAIAPATHSLYRKYRPQTFDDAELVGQEPIVRTLKNAIRLNRVAHAYLFCGPRGTGKTTTARILAKAINCLDPDPGTRPCDICVNCSSIARGTATDVVEIDAASNRGIDDVRELRDRARYAPVQLQTKIYIVDEAHQITGAAANAFLKTLEEPPLHTKFILATTDPEELLPTIISRCQRFDFRRINLASMMARLRTVAAAEELAISDDALSLIARHSTGSLRDALSILDQLSLYDRPSAMASGRTGASAIDADAVRAMLGVSRSDRIEGLVSALADRDARAVLEITNTAIEDGEDPRQINRQLVAYLRLLLHERAGGSPDADDQARTLAARFELWELADLARRFGDIDYRIKHSSYGALPFEVALIDGVLRSARASGSGESPDSSSIGVQRIPPRVQPGAQGPVSGAVDHREERKLASDSSRTPLRDRVRGVSPTSSTAARGNEDLPITAAHTAPVDPDVTTGSVPASSHNGTVESPSVVDLERLVDLWPRIRQDVKAVNRRIEALLSSVDPYQVCGNSIVLAAAYEFHRDKLNSDEVRTIVEEAIGRLVGRNVNVSCVLRDAPSPTHSISPDGANNGPLARSSLTDPPSNGSDSGANPVTPVSPAAHASDDSAADEQRLRAAKNIFDAEVLDPSLPPSSLDR